MPEMEYDTTSDWFSLGCVIFQFLTGHTPFRAADGHNKKEINRAVLEDVRRWAWSMFETRFSTALP